jgi:CubicO group peptidase (beta-lactamase class C family)
MADPNKIYRTGSISKTFTAFLMMQLVDEGVIALDDPVEQFLPEIKGLQGYADSTLITFHHLASHTSGLIREPQLGDAASGPIDQWEEKILASIPETSFKTGMDVAYSYSNIGFGILGLALSRAAGQPFMDMVETYIFEPLDMRDSYWIVPESAMPQLAIGMQSNSEAQVNERAAAEHAGRGYKVPNGGIYSTPNDLMKFMNAIMGYEDLLTDESQALMVGAQTPEGNYGYGLSLFTDDQISTAGHGGSVAGYNCYMAYDKESKYGVILMRNYNQGKTNLGRASRDLISKLKSQ